MARRREDEVEHERQVAELEAARPFLDLARQIKEQVDLAAADATTDVASLVEAIDAAPRAERQQLARAVFDALAPDEQWAVLERAFGDEEIHAYLAAEHRARLDQLRRRAGWHAYVLASREARRLDVVALPAGVELTLGLFLRTDVDAAVARGSASAVCACQLVLRAGDEPGVLHVIEDLFNPRHGLFVTPDYDQSTWARDRLDDHARVRIGSAVDDPATTLEPALYPRGRVDVERAGELRRGPLHLGFAVVGDEDVFAASR